MWIVSKASEGPISATEPTSICNPTTIITLPPDDAPRSASVAIVSATAPSTQSATPTGSSPPENRAPMISTTPPNPARSPAMARGFRRSPMNRNPASATISGSVEAMIEAAEASTHCMATKLRPR